MLTGKLRVRDKENTGPVQARPGGQNCPLNTAGAIDLSALLHLAQWTGPNQGQWRPLGEMTSKQKLYGGGKISNRLFSPQTEAPARISQVNKFLCLKLLGEKKSPKGIWCHLECVC